MSVTEGGKEKEGDHRGSDVTEQQGRPPLLKAQDMSSLSNLDSRRRRGREENEERRYCTVIPGEQQRQTQKYLSCKKQASYTHRF